MNNSIDAAIKRTRAYWFNDGLVEITVGFLFLISGIYILLQGAVSNSLSRILSLFFPILLIGGVSVGRKVLSSYKERVVYPRTGYVDTPKPIRRRGCISANLIVIVFFTSIWYMIEAPSITPAVPLVFGISMGLFWIVIGFHGGGIKRMFAMGIVSILLGIIQVEIWNEYDSGSAFYLFLMGGVMIVSGGIAFRNYLKKNVIPVEQLA
jgi:hypothetical protein